MPHYVSNQYIDGPFLLRWIIKVSFLKHTCKNKTNIKQKRYNAFNHVIRFFLMRKWKICFVATPWSLKFVVNKCTILISSKSCQISNISIIISKFCFNVFFNNDCLIFLLSKIHVSKKNYPKVWKIWTRDIFYFHKLFIFKKWYF